MKGTKLFILLLFTSLTLLAIILFLALRRRESREKFVPQALEKTICNSHFMSSNPFKYKEGEEQSEFNDDYFDKVFKKNLPQALQAGSSIDSGTGIDNGNGSSTGSGTGSSAGSSTGSGTGSSAGSRAEIGGGRSSPEDSLKSKLINWINSLSELKQKSSKPFEMYDFKNMRKEKDASVYVFTLHRPNKNHAKVIQARIVATTKRTESPVIKKLKVIGFINSYDVEANSMKLNDKKYDSLTFERLEDRWRRKADERLIPEEVISVAELQSFEEVSP